MNKRHGYLYLYAAFSALSVFNMFIPNILTGSLQAVFFLHLVLEEAVFLYQGASTISAYDRIEELEEKINEKDKQIITQQRVVIELEDMLKDARNRTSRKHSGKCSIL